MVFSTRIREPASANDAPHAGQIARSANSSRELCRDPPAQLGQVIASESVNFAL